VDGIGELVMVTRSDAEGLVALVGELVVIAQVDGI
jgi:hypothetical protein